MSFSGTSAHGRGRCSSIDIRPRTSEMAGPPLVPHSLHRWCCRQHDHVMSTLCNACHTCLVWTGYRLWKDKGTNAGPASSGVLWRMPNKPHDAVLGARLSDSFVRNLHMTKLLEVTFQDSGSAAPVPPRTRERISVPPVDALSAALSSSHCAVSSLLVSPPHSCIIIVFRILHYSLVFVRLNFFSDSVSF